MGRRLGLAPGAAGSHQAGEVRPYAEFTVAGLAGLGLSLWATGQRPHYDVVDERNDLESLVTLMAAAHYVIRDNPSVDREEH